MTAAFRFPPTSPPDDDDPDRLQSAITEARSQIRQLQDLMSDNPDQSRRAAQRRRRDEGSLSLPGARAERDPSLRSG